MLYYLSIYRATLCQRGICYGPVSVTLSFKDDLVNDYVFSACVIHSLTVQSQRIKYNPFFANRFVVVIWNCNRN